MVRNVCKCSFVWLSSSVALAWYFTVFTTKLKIYKKNETNKNWILIYNRMDNVNLTLMIVSNGFSIFTWIWR